MGLDFAGTVVEAGPDVQAVGVGARVWGMVSPKGAHVTALASRRDAEFVTGLGADEVYDYRTVKPAELEPFEVVLDTVGTDLLAWRRRLTRSGRMVTVAFGSSSALLSIAVSSIFGGGRIRSFRDDPDRRLLDDLAGHVSSGAIRSVLDTVYPLQQVGDAHKAMDEPGQRGKLVLTTT